MKSMSTVQLYLEAKDIIQYPFQVTQRLINDLRDRKSIVWLFNPYIPDFTREEVLSGLSTMQMFQFNRLSRRTVIPCWDILPESDVLRMIEDDLQYEKYIYSVTGEEIYEDNEWSIA